MNVYFDNKDMWSTSVTAWQSYFEDIGVFAQLPLKESPSSVTPVSILKSYQPDYGQMENLGIRNN